MIDTGLLVIIGSRGIIERKLPRLLKSAISKVRQKLYVHFTEVPSEERIVSLTYNTAWKINPNIDLRVLINRTRALEVDRIFNDEITDPDNPTFPVLREAHGPIFYQPVDHNKGPAEKYYNEIVLGGTFDRLHSGHKVLLSSALIIAKKLLVCGVTDGIMIQKKLLWELIEPVEKRSKSVEEFVYDVSDGIECQTVPIYDPFGPSITEPNLECIVASEETAKGAEAVNSERQKKGLSLLNVHIINLLGDSDTILNEIKISSSSTRRQLLGTILREPETESKEILSTKHYLIGLTGGIASGKTHISNYLDSLGCKVIDCDSIAHQLYLEDGPLLDQLSEQFGPAVLNADRTVNRIELGKIVFNDKGRLEKLNRLVWPVILSKVNCIIEQTTCSIVVVDAALLIESGWGRFVHQVWSVFVPRDEAIRRVCNRDGFTREQAELRLNTQLSNSERIAKSNVVFCSLWDYSETERQVSTALEYVKKQYLFTEKTRQTTQCKKR